MDFSTNFHPSTLGQPPASAPGPGEAEGTLGFAADAGSELGDSFANDLRAAEELEPAAAAEFRSAAKSIESAAADLGHAGTFLGAADAMGGAVSAYQHSDATTEAAKLADGALGGGSRLLAGAALPLAAVDLVTHGALSDLYHAGGKAVMGLVEAAQGNDEPAAKFTQAAARGDYGVIAKGVTDATNSAMQKGISGSLEGLEDLFR